MPIYQGKQLTKVGDKTGGKTKGDINGFYTTETGEKFFIKQPKGAEKKEIFTELFAGLLLKEFKQRIIEPLIAAEVFPKGYADSLIFADLIQLEDGSYALIQPFVSFVELFRLIGTGYKDGSDRDPFFEMLNGPSAYPLLTQGGQYFGLSISLMFSLWFGAYSVHSGNMVYLTPANAHPLEKSIKQFARIDWGDAFRHFASPENNKDILSPAEYDGFLNFKKFTKGYIENYRNIMGLFTAIAGKGKDIQKKMQELAPEGKTAILLLEMVNSALSQIPSDLLDDETKKELATYLDIPEFATVTFGAEGNYAAVANKFTQTLDSRLSKITELKERYTPKADDTLFQSTFQTKAEVLSISEDVAFPDVITFLDEKTIWTNPRLLDFSKLDLKQLASQFNRHLDLIAHQTEVNNFWAHQEKSNHNQLVPFYKGNTELQNGHAFVPQYREGTILRRLFTLNLDKTGAYRFTPYESAVSEYRKQNNVPSLWTAVEEVSTAGSAIIGHIRSIQKLQTSTEFKETDLAQEMVHAVAGLRDAIAKFNEYSINLGTFFERSLPGSPLTFESNFFYAISEQELAEMNGAQLATICLEELNDVEPSALLFRIIKNTSQWELMEKAFTQQENVFLARVDNAKDKIGELRELRANVIEFFAKELEFQGTDSTNIAAKEIAFKAMQEVASKFSRKFSAISDSVAEAELELSKLKTLDNNYKSKKILFEESGDKITAFSSLAEAYQALPLSLKTAYVPEYHDAIERVWLCHIARFDSVVTELSAEKLEDKIQEFTAMQDFFTKFPEVFATKYQEAFDQRKKIHVFYQGINSYIKLPTLAKKVEGYAKLTSAAKDIQDNVSMRDLHLEILKSHQVLAQIAVNELLPGDTTMAEVNQALNKLDALLPATIEASTRETFMENAINDKILWGALAETKKSALSAEVIADMLELKKFRDAKQALNHDKGFGEDYSTSVDNFYQQALTIRLSDAPIKEQAGAIVNAAEKEFRPRHSTRRLIADVLMMISVLFAGLGLFIGGARVLSDKTFFFSSMPTDRKAELTTWVQKSDTEADDARIIVAPSAA
ncbi:LepB GTPase-activating domain-containing protein [Legionella cardiaca]|uniref:LepB GTPase-activating domain-containing protein n=1 Tax=Legionella cardiaca TaxID=1071983 RepID=A0ABY8AQ31_9GAMM|nr:LepB GTPase-activating domain-containing protein [Legionella cardiaca]WED42750.1 LepB GTPase-activating domain-containing protein [Legionella cardiaca]